MCPSHNGGLLSNMWARPCLVSTGKHHKQFQVFVHSLQSICLSLKIMSDIKDQLLKEVIHLTKVAVRVYDTLNIVLANRIYLLL